MNSDRGDLWHSRGWKKAQDELRRIIGDLAKSVSMVNFRYQTHPESDKYRTNNIRNILSGGDDFTKSKVVDKDFIRDFMKNANSLESHLSIIHSRNVGCHNPNADVSALELNESSFCADCLVLNKTSIKEEEFNPFSCWRRGNLYGKVGFALSLDLIYKEGVKVWEIDCDNITLAVTKPIFANISSVKNVSVLSKPNRQMVVTINILPYSNNEKQIYNPISDIQSIFSSQLLLSKKVQSNFSSSKSDISFREVPLMVKNIILEIESIWESKSQSRDVSKEALDTVIFHNNADEMVEEIHQTLFQTKMKKIDIIKIDGNTKPDLFSSLNTTVSSIKSEGAMVAFCLDSIVDLGVRP